MKYVKTTYAVLTRTAYNGAYEGAPYDTLDEAREARRVLELFALCHNTTLWPSEVKYEPTSALVRFYRDYTRDNFICDESFAYVHD